MTREEILTNFYEEIAEQRKCLPINFRNKSASIIEAENHSITKECKHCGAFGAYKVDHLGMYRCTICKKLQKGR